MKSRTPKGNRERPWNELAIEHACPGLECSYAAVEPDYSCVEIVVTGTAEALIASGQIIQAHIDALPICGSSNLSQRTRKKFGIPWPARISRLKDGRYRVRRWWMSWLDTEKPLAIVERYGLAPNEYNSGGHASYTPAPQDTSVNGKVQSRKRNVGRFQRPVEWVAFGKLLVVNFRAARRQEK